MANVKSKKTIDNSKKRKNWLISIAFSECITDDDLCQSFIIRIPVSFAFPVEYDRAYSLAKIKFENFAQRHSKRLTAFT